MGYKHGAFSLSLGSCSGLDVAALDEDGEEIDALDVRHDLKIDDRFEQGGRDIREGRGEKEQ